MRYQNIPTQSQLNKVAEIEQNVRTEQSKVLHL